MKKKKRQKKEPKTSVIKQGNYSLYLKFLIPIEYILNLKCHWINDVKRNALLKQILRN